LLPEALRQHEARLWHIEQRPRVTIGRTQPDSALYFTGRTSFNQGCGLWFAVLWLEDPAPQRPTLERLLADLEHAGLGGERAGGFGQALIRPAGSLDLPAPDDQPWVALSRCLPNAEDLPVLLDHRAAYRVETVGGWVESPGMPAERRRSIRMLAEGSVLGPAARPAPGQVVDVQPDYGGKRPLGHPVWRNGLALAVGFTPGALEVNIP
jgi:CRISPR-associated protein Csm4